MNVRFRSRSLKRTVQFAVCLPLEKMDDIPGFPVPPKDEPLRLLMLLHGYTSDYWEWLSGSGIDFYSVMHNTAVIMPSIENSFYLDDPSREAYYSRYIAEELIDWARRAFPVSKERKHTYIGGLSMGGYGALRNGLKYNDVFGGIIALSGALITDEVARMKPGSGNPIASFEYYKHTFGEPEKVLGGDNDPKALAEKLAADKAPVPEIYLACGSEDFLIEPNRDMHRHLDKLGIKHQWFEGPGEHNMLFWNVQVEKGLAYLKKELA
jgi:S-formylglutathione hydrolase FrmB